MKTKLNFVSAAVIATTICTLPKVNAQQYWGLAGNIDATKSSKLGTTGAVPLGLYTNNTERIHIDLKGNVGIGTTNPFAGGASATIFQVSATKLPQYVLQATSATADNKVWRIIARNTLDFNDFEIQALSDAFDAEQTAFQINRNLNSIINASFPNGNVGIGTTNPSHARLEINGSVGSTVGMFGADKTGLSIQVDNSEVGFNCFRWDFDTLPPPKYSSIKFGYAAFIGMDRGSGDIYLGNFNGNQSNTNFGSITGFQKVITVKQNGYVGIGTVSPEYTFEVQNSSSVCAGKFFTTVAAGDGLVAESDNGIGPYGIKGICGNLTSGLAGYFSGNLHYTGTLTGPSDQKLKENIRPLDNVLDKLMQLKPSSFNYKNEYIKMNLPQGQQIGLIAQDVEKVFPELVKNIVDKQVDSTKLFEYKGINYIGLIPVLTKAIQEQQQEIDELKQMVSQLSQNKIVQDNSTAKTTDPVTNASLDQNTPNPFTKSTSIGYNIPPGFKSTQIVIANSNGRIIKLIPLTTTGNGEVNFNASGLNSGVYNYSLVVDGNPVVSKQMIVGK